MKRAYLFIVFLHYCIFLGAQTHFQKLSYDKALKKAASEKKLIFLQYESENCIQCNEVAGKAFADEKLMARLCEDFVPIKISSFHPDRQLVTELFDLKDRFGSLYIDGAGMLVHKTYKTSSAPSLYYSEMEVAKSRKAKMIEIEADETRYFKEGKKDLSVIRRIIQNKTDLNLDIGLLLIEYLQLLPYDSVNTVTTIQFVMKQSPVLGSRPDVMIRKCSNFKTAWQLMSPSERSNLNSRIFQKSIGVAAGERNEAGAIAVARFAMSTTGSELLKKNLYDWYMMRYFSQVKEYEKYLPLAASYYDRTFEKVTPELLYRLDSARLKAAATGGATKVTLRLARSEYSSQMHQAASLFYRLDKKGVYMDHALKWIKKSIDLNPHANNMDLYARLLYKNGQQLQAIKTEAEAITYSKNVGSERKEWYPVLEKMKRNEPLSEPED